MNHTKSPVEPEPLVVAGSGLDVVERVSEMCFGLLMALTFVGAVSTGGEAQETPSTMWRAALGCNLAWGLADAMMYLLHTLTSRGNRLILALDMKNAADEATGIGLVRNALPPLIEILVTDADLEPLRVKLVNLEPLPDRPRLYFIDLLRAARVFFIVVLSTFPVVLPFMLLDDVPKALLISRVLSLTMLFIGGFALGRYAGLGAWRAGVGMTVIGVCLTMAIIALGG